MYLSDSISQLDLCIKVSETSLYKFVTPATLSASAGTFDLIIYYLVFYTSITSGTKKHICTTK